MATISATTSVIPATVATRPLARIESPVAIGLPRMAKRGKVMCSAEEKGCGEGKGLGMGASLLAAACPATMSIEGTGLPFGLSNNFLGWILFGVFCLIWSLYFVYTSSLEEDEESGLSL